MLCRHEIVLFLCKAQELDFDVGCGSKCYMAALAFYGHPLVLRPQQPGNAKPRPRPKHANGLTWLGSTGTDLKDRAIVCRIWDCRSQRGKIVDNNKILETQFTLKVGNGETPVDIGEHNLITANR